MIMIFACLRIHRTSLKASLGRIKAIEEGVWVTEVTFYDGAVDENSFAIGSFTTSKT